MIARELKAGLGETLRYILSHHGESEFYRCYALNLGTRTVHLCSRCVGIYAGIALGLLLHAQAPPPLNASLPAVAVLPLFALLDWSLSAFAGWKGHNLLRTLSGLLLGIAYALGLALLFLTFPNYGVMGVGIFYSAAAGVLLYLRRVRGSQAERDA